MIINIKALSIMIISIMVISIMVISIMVINIMIISIMILNIVIIGILHSKMIISIMTLSLIAKLQQLRTAYVIQVLASFSAVLKAFMLSLMQELGLFFVESKKNSDETNITFVKKPFKTNSFKNINKPQRSHRESLGMIKYMRYFTTQWPYFLFILLIEI